MTGSLHIPPAIDAQVHVHPDMAEVTEANNLDDVANPGILEMLGISFQKVLGERRGFNKWEKSA